MPMKETGWQKTWIRLILTVMTVTVMVMIFCFSMENAEQSDRRSGAISTMILRIIQKDYDQLAPDQQEELYDQTQFIIRKSAHFSEYALLGILIRLCLESWIGGKKGRRKQLSLTAMICGFIYACSDEFHQLGIDGRAGTWTDVFVDSFGVMTGVMIGIILIRYTERKNRIADQQRKETDHGIFQKQ